MRTARGHGVSVIALAKQFGVHRGHSVGEDAVTAPDDNAGTDTGL